MAKTSLSKRPILSSQVAATTAFINTAFQAALMIIKTVVQWFRVFFSRALSQNETKYNPKAWLCHERILYERTLFQPHNNYILLCHSITKMASMCATVSGPQRVRDPGWRMAVSLNLRNATEPQCVVAPRPNRIEAALKPLERLIVALSAPPCAHIHVPRMHPSWEITITTDCNLSFPTAFPVDDLHICLLFVIEHALKF